jgi:hypothetical protein
MSKSNKDSVDDYDYFTDPDHGDNDDVDYIPIEK